jgi:hypothetical protein
MDGLIDFLIGYHIGKGRNPDEQPVAKELCRHMDCPRYKKPVKCKIKDCKEHLSRMHPPAR